MHFNFLHVRRSTRVGEVGGRWELLRMEKAKRGSFSGERREEPVRAEQQDPCDLGHLETYWSLGETRDGITGIRTS